MPYLIGTIQAHITPFSLLKPWHHGNGSHPNTMVPKQTSAPHPTIPPTTSRTGHFVWELGRPNLNLQCLTELHNTIMGWVSQVSQTDARIIHAKAGQSGCNGLPAATLASIKQDQHAYWRHHIPRVALWGLKGGQQATTFRKACPLYTSSPITKQSTWHADMGRTSWLSACW